MLEGRAARAARTTCQSAGRTQMSCRTLGTADFIRFPSPAASTTAATDGEDRRRVEGDTERSLSHPAMSAPHRGTRIVWCDKLWPFVQLAGRRVLVPEIRVRVAGGQPSHSPALVNHALFLICDRMVTYHHDDDRRRPRVQGAGVPDSSFPARPALRA